MKGKPRIITHDDLRRQEKTDPDERRLRLLIAIAAARFRTVECIWRHRVELEVASDDKYDKVVSDERERRDATIARHQRALDKLKNEVQEQLNLDF